MLFLIISGTYVLSLSGKFDFLMGVTAFCFVVEASGHD